MVRELKKGLFLAMIFAGLLLLTGCDSTNKTPQRYYTGYDSVEMRFLEDTPPSIFYYDSQAQFGSEVNMIPINVELYNRGSSDTYGALFIHGFDPNIVSVQGYTQGFPGFTGPGRWGTTAFGGWYGDSDNFALSGLNIPVGNTNINLGLTSYGGRKMMSFSAFGFDSRTAMFSQLGFAAQASRYPGYAGISTGIVQARLGAALNPITMGMFNAYGWDTWIKKFQLEGRSPYNPAGGMDVVEFPATILNLPPSLEQFTQRVMVTSCFDYVTHASAMVCIDPEPYSNVKKSCRSTTVSPGAGQGAPVAITSIEQRPGRGRTTFVINVKHNKKGAYDELYDYWSLYKCDPASGETVKTTDKNVVYIGYVYLSDFDITMTCIPDQMIRLDTAGSGQITCSVTFPPGMATSAYQAPLEVELWYGYSKTIYKDLIIKRI